MIRKVFKNTYRFSQQKPVNGIDDRALLKMQVLNVLVKTMNRTQCTSL